MPASSGQLVKMKITPYKNAAFSTKTGSAYTVMINPEKYSHNFSVTYNKEQAPGTSGVSTKFNRIQPEKISFELIFDVTGAVPTQVQNVSTEITKFLNAVYTYNGDIHSPNYLELSWGTFLFRCRLTSLDISYTLFRPDGSPLRAKANVSFEQYIDQSTLALSENNTSPDLTHIITVRAGDTLPLLCNQIYDSPAYYLEIARVNNLVDFRKLQPGQQLMFPPLDKTTA